MGVLVSSADASAASLLRANAADFFWVSFLIKPSLARILMKKSPKYGPVCHRGLLLLAPHEPHDKHDRPHYAIDPDALGDRSKLERHERIAWQQEAEGEREDDHAHVEVEQPAHIGYLRFRAGKFSCGRRGCPYSFEVDSHAQTGFLVGLGGQRHERPLRQNS